MLRDLHLKKKWIMRYKEEGRFLGGCGRRPGLAGGRAALLAGALLLAARPCYALPAPELAGAAMGLWEVLLGLAAIFSLWLPARFRSRRGGFKILTWLLLASIGLNVILLTAGEEIKGLILRSSGEALRDERADHPDMDWDADRQAGNPLAVDPVVASRLLADQQSGKPSKWIFVDARTPGEIQTGGIKHFLKARWPDVAAGALGDISGKTVLATCWSGMRGSEVCAKLRARGIDCRFLRGGIEGWIKQGLPVEVAPGLSLSQVGTVERYSGQERWLTATEAARFIMDKTSVVDGRGAAAFAKGSILGAVSIPIEELRSEEIRYRVGSLPYGRTMAVCFGWFSCAMADAVGWEATRQGREFVGVYASGSSALEKAIQGLKEDRAGRRQQENVKVLWDRAATGIAFAPARIATLLANPGWGLFVWGVVLAACLWPGKVAAKQLLASRKRRSARLMEAEQQAHGDQVLLARAHARVGRESLSALPWTALACIAAAGSALGAQAAGIFGAGKGALWLADLGLRDSSGVLPGIVALAAGLAGARAATNGGGSSFKVVGAGITVALPAWLLLRAAPGGVLLALLGTAAAFCVASAASAVRIQYAIQTTSKRWASGIGRLKDAADLVDPNTKAGRLSTLMRNGLPVPDGVVLAAQAFEDKRGDWSVERMIKRLGDHVAVRSSAVGEDGDISSKAGLFLSVVPAAVCDWRKASRDVADSYCRPMRGDECILVQKIIRPICAGVLFTRHPAWGGCALIEWGEGLGGRRMEGRDGAYQAVLERARASVVWEDPAGREIQAMPWTDLWELSVRVEEIFGGPQDIEWSWDGRKFWILQARPQTGIAVHGLSSVAGELEAERARVLDIVADVPEFNVLVAGETRSQLPEPSTLSMALVERIWVSGGPADLACRHLGLPWKAQEGHPPPFLMAFGRVWEVEGVKLAGAYGLISSRFAHRSCDQVVDLANSVFAGLKVVSEVRAALTWGALPRKAWAHEWTSLLADWDRAQEVAVAVGLAAMHVTSEAQQVFAKGGRNLAEWLVLGEGAFRPDSDDTGHRAMYDYELSCPRFSEFGESNEGLEAGLFSMRSTSVPPTSELSAREKAVLERAKSFVAAREKAKHEAIRVLAAVRAAALDAGRRCGASEAVFEATTGEVLAACDAGWPAAFKSVWENRRHQNLAWRAVDLPCKLDVRAMALVGRPTEALDRHLVAGANETGIFVSGSGPIEGAAITLHDGWDAKRLRDEIEAVGTEVVVFASWMRPEWVAVLSDMSVVAAVVERGSWLSHPAVLAREAGLAMVVGVASPVLLNRGQMVRVTAHGSIVVDFSSQGRGV